MRKIITLSACLCLAALCSASTVTVEAPGATSVTIEADDFTAGADISNAFSNINLSKNSIDPVYAVTSTQAGGTLGVNAIGHARGELWEAGDYFMINFNGHAKNVSLDLIAYNGTASYVAAYLEAYDEGMNLIDSDEITDLYKFSKATLSVTTSDYDIAYVIVYHITSGSKICLDNVQAVFMADYTPWADFEKIQDAIDYGTFDGINDEIVVYPSVYFEEINFYGLEATIRSTDPQDPDVVAATIIDSLNSGIGVRFSSLEGSTSVLNGLTIRNADKGIYCYWSSPLITNCVIKNNNIVGIALNFNSRPTITNCLITENPGCGVDGYDDYNGEMSNCTISDNEGNGIQNYGGDILNCIIAGNLQSGTYRCQYEDVDEDGNTFTVPAIIRNCTIVGNKDYGARGTSVLCLINSIVVYNSLSGVYAVPVPESIIILEYNDIWGNLDGSHSGGIHPSDYDIHKDPYFAVNGYWSGEAWIDDQADYHLKSMEGRWDPALDGWVTDNVHSPCIDAGNPYGSFEWEYDPNPIYEPNPNGDIKNIGAYGGTEQASKSTSGVEAPVCIDHPDMDFTGDCKVDLADFAVFTQSWLTCGLDMQETCW